MSETKQAGSTNEGFGNQQRTTSRQPQQQLVYALSFPFVRTFLSHALNLQRSSCGNGESIV